MFESNASPQTDEISECNYGISLNLERGRLVSSHHSGRVVKHCLPYEEVTSELEIKFYPLANLEILQVY